jgi:hypothetical protein
LSLAWHPNELIGDVIPLVVWFLVACVALVSQPALDLCHVFSVCRSSSLISDVRSALALLRRRFWRNVGVWLGFALGGWAVVAASLGVTNELGVTNQLGVAASGPDPWALFAREASFGWWVCLRVLWLRHATRLVQAELGSLESPR